MWLFFVNPTPHLGNRAAVLLQLLYASVLQIEKDHRTYRHIITELPVGPRKNKHLQ